jgi:hypothetical protein
MAMIFVYGHHIAVLRIDGPAQIDAMSRESESLLQQQAWRELRGSPKQALLIQGVKSFTHGIVACGQPVIGYVLQLSFSDRKWCTTKLR